MPLLMLEAFCKYKINISFTKNVGTKGRTSSDGFFTFIDEEDRSKLSIILIYTRYVPILDMI